MRLLRAVFGGPAHRRATVVIGMVLVLVAITLLSIGANSPYTHANLAPRYDERYDRTGQIVVGGASDLAHGRSAVARADAAERGAVLFVAAGCAACHGLEARGGTVARAIAGVEPALVMEKVRGGTSGMPRFSREALSDEQVAELGSYLRSLPAQDGHGDHDHGDDDHDAAGE